MAVLKCLLFSSNSIRPIQCALIDSVNVRPSPHTAPILTITFGLLPCKENHWWFQLYQSLTFIGWLVSNDHDLLSKGSFFPIFVKLKIARERIWWNSSIWENRNYTSHLLFDTIHIQLFLIRKEYFKRHTIIFIFSILFVYLFMNK